MVGVNNTVIFLLLIIKIVIGCLKPCDLIHHTVVGLGNLSVSAWIWIVLTCSTIAGSGPWCIFRTLLLQLKWCVWAQQDTARHWPSHVHLIDESSFQLKGNSRVCLALNYINSGLKMQLLKAEELQQINDRMWDLVLQDCTLTSHIVVLIHWLVK